MKTKTIVMLDTPVLNAFYLEFFRRHRSIGTLYIAGLDLLRETKAPKNEMRIDPFVMKKLINALGYFNKIEVLNKKLLKEIQAGEISIISIKEKNSIEIVKNNFSEHLHSFDDFSL